MMGLDWMSVILGLLLGAFFGPWALVKFTGKNTTQGSY